MMELAETAKEEQFESKCQENQTIKTNVIGTLSMLGLAKRIGARILLTSTSEVYGDPLQHPQTEEYWGNVNPIGRWSHTFDGRRQHRPHKYRKPRLAQKHYVLNTTTRSNCEFTMMELVETVKEFNQHSSMGSRHLDFKKSFQICMQPILTAVSKEDIHGAFQTCSNAEKESLHRLFIQVSKALHANIAEQFESKCQENQVFTTFDKIDHLVEEQTLDVLHADESNIKDVKESISTLKVNEIQYLQSLLQKVEEQNSSMENKILSLKKNQVQTNALNAVEKLKSWNSLI